MSSKRLRIAVLVLFCAVLTASSPGSQAPASAFKSFVWPSKPPAGCPFPPSPQLTGLEFTGRHVEYENADTWYPSWASDGKMYSPFTDGKVGAVSVASVGKEAATGQAVIEGDDPFALKVTAIGTRPGAPEPYEGRYPCGSLVYNGVWYYGTYALLNAPYGLNWPVLGPTPGFYISRDLGRTWTDPPHTCEPGRALFPEPEKKGGPVKIGAPHFVDFGRNMEHSPDGKAYLVGHGATQADMEDRVANLSWITADQVYLCRVTPSPETINDARSYEYFGGNDAAGRPVWTRDFAAIKPLLEWNNAMGCVTMTYDAPLEKYLMCVTDGGNTVWKYNTYILEADAITGPWRLVTYMKEFGAQAYFVTFPSKFISADGRTLWLCYAANFTNGWLGTKLASDPPGGRYGMCLQEVRLPGPAEKPGPADVHQARLRSGLLLAYRQAGSGETPIVFLHGFSLSSATWGKTLAALPPAYRAYAIDLRGFGESDKPPAGYSYADLGRDLLEFLDALGLSQAVLVGHSFGGCLLQHFAVEHPERVRALVLVGVNAMNRPARGKSPALARRLEEYGGPKANEAIFRDSMPRYFDAANLAPGDLDAFVKIGLQAGDDALRQSLLTLYTYPAIPNEAMARIGAPTLVVVGAHDPIGTFDQAVSIQDAVPGCRIAVIGHCGHSPMWEKPREFGDAFFGFLDEVVPPAGKK